MDRLVSDGLATVVSLRAKDRSFTTHLLSGRGLARRLRPGDPVSLAVDPDHVHALPLDGVLSLDEAPPLNEAPPLDKARPLD